MRVDAQTSEYQIKQSILQHVSNAVHAGYGGQSAELRRAKSIVLDINQGDLEDFEVNRMLQKQRGW